MIYQKCPVCRMPARVEATDSLSNEKDISCLRCGTFHTSDDAAWVLKEIKMEDHQRAALSYYIRRNAGLTIKRNEVDNLLTVKGPILQEKCARFLTLLSKHYPTPGTDIPAPVTSLTRVLTQVRDHADGIDYPDGLFQMNDLRQIAYLGETGLVDNVELQWLIYSCLPNMGLLADGRISGYIAITPGGWQEIARLQETNVDSRIGFVAMSFKPTFRHLYDDGLRLGIKAAGYEPLRIDGAQHNNRIDEEIIARIRQSRFVVADFSLNRGGIYFEAGFAMGLGLPVIWIAREDRLRTVYFDTRQFNYITWKSDDFPALVRTLQLRIEATIGCGPLKPAN